MHSPEKRNLLVHLILQVVKEAELLMCDELDQPGMTEELMS